MRKQCSACGAVSNALNGMSSSNLGSFVHNLKNEASELQAATKELKGEILKAKQAQRQALENTMSAITWTWLGIAKEKKNTVGIQNAKTRAQDILEGIHSHREFVNALNCFYNSCEKFLHIPVKSAVDQTI